MTTPGRQAGTGLLVLGLLVGVAGLASVARGKASALRAAWPAEADLMYLPSSTTLRRLALGHHELAADLVSARANVYFGTQLAAKAPQRWLSRYLHAAVDLDPRFHRLYLSGAAMLVYHGGALSAGNVLEANALITRGLRTFPADWNFHFQLGFNTFYELPQLAGPDDPRVAGWRQAGVESLRQATLFEGAPAWLPNLVARLLTKQGADELAVRHLEQAYAVTSNTATREQIRAKLQALRGGQVLREMEEQRLRFEQDLARAYPYAPEAFSVLTGPRQPRVVQLPGLDGERPAPSTSAPAP